MKTILFLLMMFLLSPLSSATPPGDLVLTYDMAKGALTASGPHPTQDLTEHFIRRLEITVNSDEQRSFYFPRQISRSVFNDTVPLELKPGDAVHVKAYCSEGGTIEADLAIPYEQSPEPPPMVDLKAIKDQDHSTIQVVP